jgi:O-antigen ligase
MILVAAVVSIYAWQQHLAGVERVTAPFEGKQGEANTLGGYLIMMMTVALAFLLNTTRARMRLAMAGFLVCAFPAFLFTLSRSSWFSFIPALLLLFFLTPRGKVAIFLVLLVAVLLSPLLMPRFVQQRVDETFVGGGEQYRILGKRLTLDESTSSRIQTWQDGLRHWTRSPVLGYGVSSVGPAFDNQYIRVLMETGALGLFAFLFMLWSLAMASVESFNECLEDEFSRSLIIGFIAGFAGILIHALGAATFILIRVMEPFWFLAAIIVILPQLHQPEPEAEP